MEGSGICQVKSNPVFNIKTLFCHMNKNKPFESQGHILRAILWVKTPFICSANQLSRTKHIAALRICWRSLACSFNEVRVSLIMIFSSSKRIQRNRGPFIYRAMRQGPPSPHHPALCQALSWSHTQSTEKLLPSAAEYPGRFSHQITQLKRIKSQTSPLL